MKITLTLKNSTALLFLSFLMQETHELAHTGVGRLLCGSWGSRNFNVWGISSTCTSEQPLTLLATFAGPLYSFAVIWIGYYLLTRSSARKKSVGFALVVSSMPFSRVLTPIFGSGDEIFALTRLGVDKSLAWVIALVAVFALTVPPMVKIYKTIDNRRKALWIIGLLLVPFLAVGLVVFALLQGMVLQNGILDQTWIMGSPMLVSLWLFVSMTMVAIFHKHLSTFLKEI